MKWPTLKTVGLVTLVTLLIWVWAEAESLSTIALTPRVEVVSPGPEVDVRVLAVGEDGVRGAWTGAARVELEGSTLAIDRAERELAAGPVRLTPGVGGMPGTPGEHEVDLREALRKSAALVRTGVIVLDVRPPTVTMVVTALVTRELPVRPDLSRIEVEGDVVVTPPTVRVTMPAEAAARLVEGAVAVGVLDPEDVGRLREDVAQTVRATVRLPEGINGGNGENGETGGLGGRAGAVLVSPGWVNVTLRPRRQVASVTLPSVPVWISLPPIEGTRWDVEVPEPFLRNVTVTGPSAVVEQIRRQELRPVAYLLLSSEELEAGVKSKEAVFTGLPTALEFSVESRMVGIEIRRREGDDGSPEAGAGTPGTP